MEVFWCIEEDDGHEFVPFSGWLKLHHTPKPTPSPSMMDYKEEQEQHTEEKAEP
jgi:hypothetical protein